MIYHGTCVEKILILSRIDNQEDGNSDAHSYSHSYVYMNALGLNEMPDELIYNGINYKYSGVLDGQGYYTEVEQICCTENGCGVEDTSKLIQS